MNLISVSLADIEEHLIDWFAVHFGDSPSTLLPGTDVRKRYNYQPAAWLELADVLSKQPWMIQIGVQIVQNDVRLVSTIEQIAAKILSKVKHLVAAPNPLNVVPLSTLSGLAMRQLSATIPGLLPVESRPPRKSGKTAKRAATKPAARKRAGNRRKTGA